MKMASLLALVTCAGLPLLAQAPVSLNIADVATARLGFQGQFQLQSNTDPVVQGTSSNFVIRRCRLLAGGTIGERFDWLFDVDAPNIGKIGSNIDGQKNLNNLYIQDAVLTTRFCPGFVLDTGILTVDPNHNGLTSSARYLGNDAAAYASLQNTPLGNSATAALTGSSPFAREVGLSARGLVGQHLEYHFAVTNGYRNSGNDQAGVTGTATPSPALPAATAGTTIAGNNALRTTLRVQYDLFDNEGAGYSVAETYFGAKKIVSFGLGLDRQDSYRQTTGDVFVDLPLKGGDVVTGTANYWLYDGGTFLPSLPRQKDWSLQAGYLFKATGLEPIVRVESRRMDTPVATALDEDRQCLGLAYWIHAQRANLKVFYNAVKPRNLAATSQSRYHQVTAQFQLLAW